MPGPKPTSAVKVVADGTEIPLEKLLDVQVRDNLTLPDTAVVRIRDPEAKNVDHEFKLGQTLEVSFGAADADTLSSVFKGEIVALEPEYNEGDCIVAARAYDRGWRLNRQRTSRTFQNQTPEDMVRTVASAAGLSAGQLHATGVTHEFFQQSMETDWEFCRRLASLYDCEFFIQDRSFNFLPRAQESPAVTLTWGGKGSLISFKPRMSGVGQVSQVTVANHDPKAAQAVTAQASTPQIAGASNALNGRAGDISKLDAGNVVVADQITATQAEATALAQSTLDRLAKSFIEADGKAFGDPRLRANATIKLEQVGQFSGEYVLAQTTHTFRGRVGYTTAFLISGRTTHTFSDLLKRSSSDWASSLVVGVVTNTNDPDGMGRVRVKFPALGSDIEGWWARVATINAGADRGLFMLPEPGDEVVVGFEHGDARRPFVLGSLYTGKNKVPADLKDSSNDRKAKFGVKSDHEVHVEGKQAMKLKTGETLVIEVNRDGQGGTGDTLLDAKGKIEEKAATTFKISAGQTIEIEASQSVTISGTGGVTVKSSGPLKLEGATVDINANGPVNVKGMPINLG
jgi:uncharacterized protein involved in type VI secretion and phage assembly